MKISEFVKPVDIFKGRDLFSYFVDFTGDFLVAEIGGRLMLRGFFNSPVAGGRVFTYTDVTPFIRQLIAKSHDMFLMPLVPQEKKKTSELIIHYHKKSNSYFDVCYNFLIFLGQNMGS